MRDDVDTSELDDGRITFGHEPETLGVAEMDPVCGMKIFPSSATASREYQGKTYYFCSQPCRHTFDEDPDRYAG
jgi:YHS domain-containing protein